MAMAEKESPLAELAETSGVRLVCVFGPDGSLLSCVPSEMEGSSWMGFLQAWTGHPCLSQPQLREMALFYPNSLVIWRRIQQEKELPDGSLGSGQALYRNLLLVAEPSASLSLLRVSLDVKEHGWRGLGIQKVFPSASGKGSGGSILSKLFRRPGN